MKLTSEQGRDLLYGCLDGFEVIEDAITGHRRWSVDHEIVFKEDSTGKYYRTYYSKGATECQHESPFDNDEPEIEEVALVEKIVMTWEPVK